MSCPETNLRNMTALTDLPFDGDEQHILKVARYFFRSFALPESQSWIAGVGVVLEHFDHRTAPHIYVATLGAVQSMRQARKSVFSFNDPGCMPCSSRATDVERLFLGALRAMRINDPDRAAAFATVLCEGNDAARWLMTLRTLAEQMPPRAQTPASPAALPDVTATCAR